MVTAVLRGSTLLAAAFALTMAASASAEPSRAKAPQPAQIDRNGVLILIRSTLIALQQGNETGNYTVLRDLSAPGFQQANNAARLGDIFANLRNQRLDLAGVTVLDPQLTLLPQIEQSGLMHMAGFFPSVPTQINFELQYAPVNGRWRLFGISVQLGSSSPTAPGPVASGPPAGQDPRVASVAPPTAVKPANTPSPRHRTVRVPAKPEAKEPDETKPAPN